MLQTDRDAIAAAFNVPALLSAGEAAIIHECQRCYGVEHETPWQAVLDVLRRVVERARGLP